MNAGVNSRIREARIGLHYSQEYVAKNVGISRTAVVEIEKGNRKVSAEELGKFSILFGISADELLSGTKTQLPIRMAARGFSELDKGDQQEILNLIEFKRMMRGKVTNV